MSNRTYNPNSHPIETDTEYTGLTANTVAWLDSHRTLLNGCSYRELDGEYRVYEIKDGVWHLQ